MKNRQVIMIATVAAAFVASAAQAQVAPNGNWASLPPNSYGGSGIPTIPSMVGNGVGGVTIALAATQRLTGPNLQNSNGGVFYGVPGFGVGTAATWNFDFYVRGGNVAAYNYTLYFDVDAGAGVNYGTLGFRGADIPTGIGDSENLTFAFLYAPAGTFPNLISHTPPSGVFDPNAIGIYNFVLEQRDAQTNQVVDYVAIDVATAPEPASFVLLATGLLGVGAAARRRRKA